MRFRFCPQYLMKLPRARGKRHKKIFFFTIFTFSTAFRCWCFSEKKLKKCTCVVMIRIIITFANQMFVQLIWLQVLKIWSKFQKIWVCKKLGQQRESFSPNTGNPVLLFLNGSEFSKVQWINRKWNVMQDYVLIIFFWTFPY